MFMFGMWFKCLPGPRNFQAMYETIAIPELLL